MARGLGQATNSRWARFAECESRQPLRLFPHHGTSRCERTVQRPRSAGTKMMSTINVPCNLYIAFAMQQRACCVGGARAQAGHNQVPCGRKGQRGPLAQLRTRCCCATTDPRNERQCFAVRTRLLLVNTRTNWTMTFPARWRCAISDACGAVTAGSSEARKRRRLGDHAYHWHWQVRAARVSFLFRRAVAASIARQSCYYSMLLRRRHCMSEDEAAIGGFGIRF